jgi:quercetin dioxygenase-like cupin family protein
MTVKHAQDIPSQPVKAGDHTALQVLISGQEGPHFAMRRFVMGSGGGMPTHTNSVEHEQYVLQGHANIGIGDETYEVKAGDVVFIPEGVPHFYQNLGEEDFIFLCMIPTGKQDVITILDEKNC